ncbi:Fc.00g082980.m01.CDS01 [Cosmosporella sp. VM-42]
MSPENQDLGQAFLENYRHRPERELKQIYGGGSEDLSAQQSQLERKQSDNSVASGSSKVLDYGFRSRSLYKLQNESTRPQNGGIITAESGRWSETVPPSGAPFDVADLEDPPSIDLETESIETLLHNATLDAINVAGGKEWLPATALDDIFQPSKVLAELKQKFPGGADAEHYTEYVFSGPKGAQNEGVSSLQILAILIIIHKVEKLPCFIKSKLTDEHLPFLWLDGPRKTGLYSGSQSSPYGKEALPCFIKKDGKGDAALMKPFYAAQWQMVVPFLTRDSDDDVKEYQLHKDAIMPWTHFGAGEESGFSMVRRVKIHRAHHTFKHKSFALKTLLQNHPLQAAHEFSSELKVFRKMRQERHLLELCATFKVEKQGFEEYSFLFPWADGGNLLNLWTKQPSKMLPGKPVTPRLFLHWIAEQCCGLAGALRSMHDLRKQAFKRTGLEDRNREKDDEYYGIHGDIKPENILHFSQLDSPTGLGILKIADFGLSRFHSSRSRTTQGFHDTPVPAPTYQAPELVGLVPWRSRKVDIWSLGCVFSQFMTWLVLGPESVKRFDKLRRKERDFDHKRGEEHRWKSDKFFKADYFQDDSVQTSLKKSTTDWLDELYQKVKNDQGEVFLTEFLSLIKHGMLEHRREKRIGCDDLVDKLEAFASKIEGPPDDPYWNTPLPTFALSASTDDTDLKGSSRVPSRKRSAESSDGERKMRPREADRRVSFELRIDMAET